MPLFILLFDIFIAIQTVLDEKNMKSLFSIL